MDLDVFEIGGRREGHLRPNLEMLRFARVEELVTTDLATSGSQNWLRQINIHQLPQCLSWQEQRFPVVC